MKLVKVKHLPRKSLRTFVRQGYMLAQIANCIERHFPMADGRTKAQLKTGGDTLLAFVDSQYLVLMDAYNRHKRTAMSVLSVIALAVFAAGGSQLVARYTRNDVFQYKYLQSNQSFPLPQVLVKIYTSKIRNTTMHLGNRLFFAVIFWFHYISHQYTIIFSWMTSKFRFLKILNLWVGWVHVTSNRFDTYAYEYILFILLLPFCKVPIFVRVTRVFNSFTTISLHAHNFDRFWPEKT